MDNDTVLVPSSVDTCSLPNEIVSTLRKELIDRPNLLSIKRYGLSNFGVIDSAFHNIPLIHDNSNNIETFTWNELSSRSCRSAFLHMFVSLLGCNYDKFLLFPSNTSTNTLNEIFDVGAFISSRPRSYRKFLNKLLDSQAFVRYIEEKIFSSNRDDQLKYFTSCCIYESGFLNSNKRSNFQNRISAPNLVTHLAEQHFVSEVYTVPPPFSEDLPPNVIYKYSEFPFLKKSLILFPRPLDERNMESVRSNYYSKTFKEFDEVSSSPVISRSVNSGHKPHLFKSCEEWAYHLLSAVYSC